MGKKLVLMDCSFLPEVSGTKNLCNVGMAISHVCHRHTSSTNYSVVGPSSRFNVMPREKKVAF